MNKPLAVEVKPLENFYTAEEYHQKYLEKNPSGYCHISPAMFEAAKNPQLL
ncbi:MAG: peptide-methionine (S)-S-oxide reductase [Acetatifactor sp.]|nr:peptide-methionine (S)-S-oxide reductase [Acetatifactor sp.]